jgi:hypothetical protein
VAVGLAAFAFFLRVYVGIWSPEFGLTKFLRVGQAFDDRGTEVFRATPKFIDAYPAHRWGFDGQLYAEIALDPLAIVFTLVVTLVTGLGIGLLPALQASNLHMREALNESSRGSTGTGRRLRAGLLVAEVALSLVLLIAAGLLLTSFAKLQRVEPGFQPEGLFTAQLVQFGGISVGEHFAILLNGCRSGVLLLREQ